MFSLRALAPAAFAVVALCGSLFSAHAATFEVRGGDTRSLIGAINAANANGQDDTINLDGFVNFSAADNATYGPTGFPVIANDGALTINGVGGGSFIGRVGNANNPEVRILAIAPGARVTINNLRFARGSAGTGQGGSPDNAANRGGAIFNAAGATLTLNGCDFDLNEAVSGGAIFNGENATTTINGGTFSSNASDANGGVIYNEGGSVALENVNLSGNQARGVVPDQGGRGGAIYLRDDARSTGFPFAVGNLTVKNCVFGDGNGGNLAILGGAISSVSSGSIQIERSHFRGNRARFGGAIDNESTLSIVASTFSDNSAEISGGAMVTQGRPVDISNSTFSGNSAPDAGSAIDHFTSTLTLESCTLSRNEGGAALNSAPIEGSTARVSNTIIAGNSSDVSANSLLPPESNSYQSGGYNLIGTGNATLSFNASGDRTGVTNPRLSPLRNNVGATPTLVPLADSPAIDQGLSALQVDQTGNFRPIDIASVANAAGGDGSDIGAVEYDAPQTASDTAGLVVNTVFDNDDGTCGLRNCSLREAINAANTNGRSPSIEFEPLLFGNFRKTITLSGSRLPDINTSRDLQIAAPSIGLTIDGTGRSGVFLIGRAGRATLRGLTIRGGNPENSFNRTGGGVLVKGAATVINCTLTGNSSPFDGGAVAVDTDGTLGLIQCTLAGNRARAGSDASNFRGRLTIESCTLVSDNSVTSTDNFSGSNTQTFIANSLVAGRNAVGNNGGNGASSYRSGGYNIVTGGAPTSLVAFRAPGDRTDLALADLKLGSLAENGGGAPTIAPGAESPVIDGGAPSLTDATAPGGPFDGRGAGFPRVVFGRIDVGAYETQQSAVRVVVSIAPRAPQTADVTTATPVVDGSTRGQLSYQYRWFRNGQQIVGETTPTLNLAKTGNGDKGDAISVEVRAFDGNGISNPATASVSIVNSAPTAVSSQGSVPAETEKAFPLLGFDADGDPLTFKRVGGPVNGTADIRVDPADGKLKLFYKSRARYGGVEVIRFVALDNEGKPSNVSTLGITVQYTAPPPANRAPIAGDTNIDTVVGRSEVKGLLGSDPDGDAITFRIVGNAKFGRSEIRRDTDGFFKLFYTSLPRFFGPDRVTYIVTDSRGKESNLATVNINFVNRSPVAQPNDLQVASGELVSQFLFADDPDNDAITFRLVNNPQFGTGEIKRDEQGAWRVYYRSVPGYVGPDRITFIAIDPFGKESQVATANINVVRVGPAPSALKSSAAPSGGGS